MTSSNSAETDAETNAGQLFRYTGAVSTLSLEEKQTLFDRSTSSDDAIRAATANIIAKVRQSGDEALRQMALDYDGVALERFEVPKAVWQRALDQLAPELRRSMERAAKNIAHVHSAFRPSAVETEPEPGLIVGRRPDALKRVGVYAPGGRAAYPSSVLMGAIPARVAGVEEIILCSPPDKSGAPSSVVLAAAALANVDRVFAIGGAGAIAALAYGTQSVPRVDRIVGPGNAYVAEAKLQVSGAVAIDSPAGPSELLVVGDDSVDPNVIAREVMAQAEHDPQAAVVVVMIGDSASENKKNLEVITNAVQSALSTQPRRSIIATSLATRGALLSVSSVNDAAAFSNDFAPEHLLLAIRDIDRAVSIFRNAGTIFLGETSSVAYGDYMTGANHVLPTGGLARSYSGLSTLDFVRWTTYQRVSPTVAQTLANDVGVFADAEGLPAHSAAARQWQTTEPSL